MMWQRWVSRSKARAGESFGAEEFSPMLERQARGDDHRGALVGGGHHVEEEPGADCGGWGLAEFVKEQQIEPCDLGLERA